VEPDLRDAVVAFIRRWAEKTGLAIEQLLKWLELSAAAAKKELIKSIPASSCEAA
jgi:hypothetical protein